MPRAVFVCVETAIEAARLGAEQPNHAAHLVRREMKRLRAILQLAPKPRPEWVVHLAAEAAAIHRELAELRDGCVVTATLGKVRARHPRRWKALLPVPSDAAVAPTARMETSWTVVGRRLGALPPLLGATGRGFSPGGDLGGALAATYRKARRARTGVFAAIDQEAVHAWRKALYRLCYQLELAAPLLSRSARGLQQELAPLTQKLGRCGDLAMTSANLKGRRLVGVKASARGDLLDWIERRRRRIAREVLTATAVHFRRRPRDFAKWCLR